ncbi:MAG: tRNA (guanine(10)-N(2))-dimethyltransferase [Candidatus Thorarchaeota archaeon]
MENLKRIKLKEGSANFYIYEDDLDKIPSKAMNVFYNEKMILNRDITLLTLIAYQTLYKPKILTIVDSMAASGIGSIRFLLECKGIKKIYINDINPIACNLIEENLKLNGLYDTNTEIILSNKDANFLFSEINQNHILNVNDDNKPNVISIDPFGTPNLYLDTAFKAIKKDMSILCITATDSAVLFGVKPEVCFRKYLSKPLHNEYCKEIGTRILLHFIARIANVNKLGIKPLLCFYSQHFIRIFCLTLKTVNTINQSFKNYGFIIHCNKCGFRKAVDYKITNIDSRCSNCNTNSDVDYAGPLWIGEIHQIEMLNIMKNLNQRLNLPNKKRIIKLLNFIYEEIDMPFSYYNIHKLAKSLSIETLPKIEKIINKIREMGYKASRTHFDFTSIKTNLEIKNLKKLFISNQLN